MSIVFWICFYVSLFSVLAVRFPNHNCDNYFTYDVMNGGKTYIGIFTPNNTGMIAFFWKAIFSSRGAYMDQVDFLNPYPSNEEWAVNVRSGKPAKMFVKFIDIEDELPMLTSLILNDVTLCVNPTYSPPSTTVILSRNESFFRISSLYNNVGKTLYTKISDRNYFANLTKKLSQITRPSGVEFKPRY
ncbi:uncharacterized protein LOC108044348 [Drosophila rhopaloa]|uniref:Uncharacterized protein LOC108044348 n=1 Tax=Drosophila rhopaloa TaxID=1041015 RepID=A0A6P4EUQ3_DRORH|nr:uncharacterized protein LOC108044348 [Drosophila rhopaloa]